MIVSSSLFFQLKTEAILKNPQTLASLPH